MGAFVAGRAVATLDPTEPESGPRFFARVVRLVASLTGCVGVRADQDEVFGVMKTRGWFEVLLVMTRCAVARDAGPVLVLVASVAGGVQTQIGERSRLR